MKTNKTNKTNTESDGGRFTMVRTGYARVAVLLLAVNFCLTAYAFIRLNDYVDQRLEVKESGVMTPAKVVQKTQD